MFINLRMKSVLQSWGNQSNTHTTGSYRGTNEFPTLSGIIGMLCACNGINFNRDYEKYKTFTSSIKYISAVARKHFTVLVDAQNMGGGYRKDIPFQRMMVPVNTDGSDYVGQWRKDGDSNTKRSEREYLEDADFIVTIEVPDDISDELIARIKNPVWMPVFGRSCCIPSDRIFSGAFSTYEVCIASAKTILNVDKLIAYVSQKPEGKYYTFDVYDVPVCTQQFKYTKRRVYKTIM